MDPKTVTSIVKDGKLNSRLFFKTKGKEITTVNKVKLSLNKNWFHCNKKPLKRFESLVLQ